MDFMDTNELGNHISQRFNDDLAEVRSEVLKMGGIVEQQIENALLALRDTNTALGEAVVRRDVEVNALEVKIDEECSRIIALRQPTALDLRMVMMVIKTITDLERMGDEAEKIGRLSMHLGEVEGPAYRYSNSVQHIGSMVRSMLHDTLNAFARMDVEEALVTAQRDQEVDREYEALTRQSITYMMEDPRSITSVLDVMWAARALERIGDHAKNICEYVIYLVEGKDVRHVSVDQIEQEIRSAD